MDYTKNVLYNSLYGDLPIPSIHGYNFLGWYKEPNFETLVSNNTIFDDDSDIILYAKLEPKQKKYFVEENGNTYFYNENGVLQKGMITDSKTKKEYYANDEGILQKGLIELNGKKYFFKDDYTMTKGEFIKVEGKIYYFGAASGSLQKSG